VTGLASLDDYRRQGFTPYLRSPEGIGEVRRFVRVQLDEALRDPDHHFPFASLLAGYARGRYLEDVPRDLRGTVRRRAIDALWQMHPDLLRLAWTAQREDTRLAVLRALILGLPTVVLEQSEASADRRVLRMVDVWLLAHATLGAWQDQPAPVVRMTSRGLIRWRSGWLAEELLAGTGFGAFLDGLSSDERRPHEEIRRIEEMLEPVADRAGAVLFRLLTLDPATRAVAPERWEALAGDVDGQGDALRAALEDRAGRALPGDASPAARASLLLDLVADRLR